MVSFAWYRLFTCKTPSAVFGYNLRIAYLFFWLGLLGFLLFLLHGYYHIPFFFPSYVILAVAFLFLCHFMLFPSIKYAFWQICFLPLLLNLLIIFFLAEGVFCFWACLTIILIAIFSYLFLRRAINLSQQEMMSVMTRLSRGLVHRLAPIFYRDERGSVVSDLNKLCVLLQEKELMCQHVSPELWAEIQKDTSSRLSSARELTVVSLVLTWHVHDKDELARLERFFVLAGQLCKKYHGFLNSIHLNYLEILFFANQDNFQKQAILAVLELQNIRQEYDQFSMVLRQIIAKSGLVEQQHGFRYRIITGTLHDDFSFLHQTLQENKNGFYVHQSFLSMAERFFHTIAYNDIYTALGNQRDLQFHLQNLASPKVDDRLMSMRVIESHRYLAALPELIKLLDDVSPRVRIVAARVLVALTEPSQETKVGALLLDYLAKEWNHEVRATIIIALGELRRKEFLSPLLPLLHDENDRVRANAIEAVGYSLDRRIVLRHLEGMLTDRNNRARANAALAIWLMGEKKGFQELLQMAGSNDVLMRCSGLFGLGEIFTDENMRILTEFIIEPVSFYLQERHYLFQAAFDLCEQGLDFPHQLVERNAAVAFKKMRTIRCVPLLSAKYQTTDDEFVRQVILETLVSLDLFTLVTDLKNMRQQSVQE